jgi:hypothetical protein
LIWPGIHSKKAGQVTMSKERFFDARGKKRSRKVSMKIPDLHEKPDEL